LLDSEPTTTRTRPFVWTPQREWALELLVEDRLTDQQIASQIGVSRRTIGYWKAHPDFIARVEKVVEANRRQLVREAIARAIR
jgi:hypothetical protein